RTGECNDQPDGAGYAAKRGAGGGGRSGVPGNGRPGTTPGAEGPAFRDPAGPCTGVCTERGFAAPDRKHGSGCPAAACFPAFADGGLEKIKAGRGLMSFS